MEFIYSSGWGGGERLFDFDWEEEGVGAYSRWALIRGWALIRINTVHKKITIVQNYLHIQYGCQPAIQVSFVLYANVPVHDESKWTG